MTTQELPEMRDTSFLAGLRYWLIRWLAGRDSLLVNAQLDHRGCVLTVPALIAGNVIRPGAKLLVLHPDGEMSLGEERPQHE